MKLQLPNLLQPQLRLRNLSLSSHLFKENYKTAQKWAVF
jgi:hypothetical protein